MNYQTAMKGVAAFAKARKAKRPAKPPATYRGDAGVLPATRLTPPDKTKP